MVDIPKVPGAGGPTDPLNRGKVGGPDGDKFKDLMKVGDTDADQKKKKKQQQEAMEEAKAQTAAGAPLQEKDKSNVDLQKFRKPAKVERAQDSEKKQPKHEKRPEETAPNIQREPVEKKAPIKTSSPVSSHPQKAAPAKPTHSQSIPEGAAPPPTAPIQQGHIPQPQQKKAEKSPDRPLSSPPPTEKEKPPEKKYQEPGKELVVPIPSSTLGPFFLPPASATPPSFTMLRPEMFALLEKLVSMIMVMHETGMTETVIHLSPNEFKAFAGAQIIIREYTTAPKAFNIEFQGNAQNSAFFQQNVSDLMAAFQYGQYNFKINRIDTSLLPSEKPLFHRKEEPKDKGEKEGGQQ